MGNRGLFIRGRKMFPKNRRGGRGSLLRLRGDPGVDARAVTGVRNVRGKVRVT